MSTHTDKRQVATDALETLGTIIGPNEKRDAIHLAVEPVEAAESLWPAQHVELTPGGKAYGGRPENGVGIVDPFLQDEVKKGQRFWLVVYPRQITSLRHVWEHPKFPTSGDVTLTPAAQPERQMSESERWIRDFAERVGLGYQTVMDGAKEWLETHDGKWGGEYLCFGGLLEGASVPDEFWNHYERVTGETVEQRLRGSFFTCSC